MNKIAYTIQTTNLLNSLLVIPIKIGMKYINPIRIPPCVSTENMELLKPSLALPFILACKASQLLNPIQILDFEAML